MLIVYFILCFTATMYGMEDERIYQIEPDTRVSYIYTYRDKKNNEQYALEYNNACYRLDDGNISHNIDDCSAFIHQKCDDLFLPNKSNIIRPVLLQNNAPHAFQALGLKNAQELWNYFSNLPFDVLIEFDATYASIQCTEYFNKPFYLCLILKRFFKDPTTFNLKTYLFNQDEAKLFSEREVPSEEERKLENLLKRSNALIKYKTCLYLANIFKKNDPEPDDFENFQADQKSVVYLQLEQVEIDDDVEFDSFSDSGSNRDECVSSPEDYFFKYLFMPEINTLDFSHFPITKIEKETVNILKRACSFKRKDINKIKLFCNLKSEENFSDICYAIDTIRKFFPCLKNIYLTDSSINNLLADQGQFDEFTRAIFYPYDNFAAFFAPYVEPKPINVHIDQKIYMKNNLKNHTQRFKHIMQQSFIERMEKNILSGCCMSGLLIFLWHLIRCKKNLNFLFKTYLFGLHAYTMHENYIFASIFDSIRYFHYTAPNSSIFEFLFPISLCLLNYRYASVSPNTFSYGGSFFINAALFSYIFFCFDPSLNSFKNLSKTFDDKQIKDIYNHGQFIFPYDPAKPIE